MSSSAGPSGSDPPEIPKRTLSKRGREELEKQRTLLEAELEKARKQLKPTTSFDAKYWISASKVASASFEHLLVETKIAVRDWVDSGEPAVKWWATIEARRIVDQLKAASLERRLSTEQAEQIARGGPIRRYFQAMFTTSQLGIGAEKVGMGKRTRSEQEKFKMQLIEFYGAATYNPKKPKVIVTVHDSATGHEMAKSDVRAAHLFPHKIGPDLLVMLLES
jgi:hypothetical protein